jgi:hypothetical protein
MSDLVEDQLVAEVAQDQVEQIPPQQAPIFPLLSEAYFQDPDKMLEAQGKDEMLGFGLEVGAVLLTPVVLTVTKDVIEFIAGIVMTSVQTQSSGLINEFVEKMFTKFRREGEERGEKLPPPPAPPRPRAWLNGHFHILLAVRSDHRSEFHSRRCPNLSGPTRRR